ncbi:MAG TPA: YetF domain-containing protein [Candidatus Limnocylindrales bacterium]|nr:YetF domain-containing protein [Candidatus Limnocylindrales bacterium]
MFTLTLSPLELIARSAIVYILFLAALRLSGKRELGQFTIFDLALVLLASNALQPAITGPDASIPAALIIVATLFTLNRLTALARKRSALARRILDSTPTVVARDGKWLDAAIAKEDLDSGDLQAAIREYGLASIKDVQLATLEHDGSISVVPAAGPTLHMRHRRRYRRRPNVSQ